MAKYAWAWKDDEGLYLNEASSIEAIIQEIIEYYDEDVEELEVEVIGETLVVKFISYLDNDWSKFDSAVTIVHEDYLNRVQCVIPNELWDAEYFLNRLAEFHSKYDDFRIIEIE